MTELQMFCISVLGVAFKSENPCFVYLCSRTHVKRICVVHMCSRIYVMALCFQGKKSKFLVVNCSQLIVHSPPYLYTILLLASP